MGCLTLCAALLGLTGSTSQAQQDVRQCTTIRGKAVYKGYGYYHVVEVDNGCQRRVQCDLWTDVDPEPKYHVKVEPGETGSVVTRKGSPARVFQALGECRFD